MAKVKYTVVLRYIDRLTRRPNDPRSRWNIAPGNVVSDVSLRKHTRNQGKSHAEFFIRALTTERLLVPRTSRSWQNESFQT